MAERGEETTPLTSRKEKRRPPCSSTMMLLIVIIAVLVVLAIVIPTVIVVTMKNKSASKNSTDPDQDDDLINSVCAENIMTHLKALQGIGDENSNSDTPSRSVDDQYNASASYVQEQLEAAGYKTWIQTFVVPVYRVLGPATFRMMAEQEDEGSEDFTEGYDFEVMRYSGNGTAYSEQLFMLKEEENNKDGELPPTGCSAVDFEEMNEPSIVILKYNTNCSYYEKARQAELAGATAIIFFNDDEEYKTQGPSRSRVRGERLNETVGIPVISLSYRLGQQFSGKEMRKARIMIETSTSVTMSYTYNLFAETRYGRGDRLIVVGSHLDSVQDGVGINDNGSGSSTNLEIALQMARLKLKPVNKVRFAWWGAEELGLLGSKHYTSSLSDKERANHSLNLNFDMLGSPNYIRAVYNGSGFTESTDDMKYACTQIQKTLEKGFASQNVNYSIVPFTGRSDYGSFIEPGIDIPAGALSSGGDGIKTTEERAMYGGLANAAFDTCYHQACDTTDNIDQTVLGQMANAAVYTLEKFMYVEDLKAFLYDDTYKAKNDKEEPVNSRKRRAVRRNPIHLFNP